MLDADTTAALRFSWNTALEQILHQTWDFYEPNLVDRASPAWRLLYDEYERDVVLDESEQTTLLILLGHSDTARIQATAGTNASRGTQYFWLSRDCYGFFPPLTIRNQHGRKATFSCLINMRYIDLNLVAETRVTFEAENNLDFRLGTGPLRGTRLAVEGDLAAITRLGESQYELRIIKEGTHEYELLFPHTINFIGHQGKRYGYIDNDVFGAIVGVQFAAIKAQRN